MAEVPDVRVSDVRLDGALAVAVRDTTHIYDLAIDFSKPPAAITAGLEAIFRDAIETERWTRRQGDAGPNSAT